jgi:hypothetical protein
MPNGVQFMQSKRCGKSPDRISAAKSRNGWLGGVLDDRYSHREYSSLRCIVAKSESGFMLLGMEEKWESCQEYKAR